MNFFALAWAGVNRNRFRMSLLLGCIAAAFTLFGVLYSINVGFVRSKNGLGQGTSRLFVLNKVSQVDSLPLIYMDRIRAVPEVLDVVQSVSLLAYYQDPKNSISCIAVDARAEFAVFDEFLVSNEALDRMTKVANGALIGRTLAEKLRVKVGDRLPLQSRVWVNADGTKNWVFDVVGVYDAPTPEAARRVFINFEYFDQARVSTLRGAANGYVVKADGTRNLGEIGRTIDLLFENSANETQTQSEGEMARSRMKRLGDVAFLIGVIVSATFVTLLMVIGHSLSQSVFERRAEYATLKALGFSDAYLSGLAILECLILFEVGAIVGLVAASRAVFLLPKDLGIFELTLGTVFVALSLAALMAVISAFFPARRIRNQPIAIVLTQS